MESQTRVLGERERNSFIDLQAKGPQWAHALKTVCPDLGGSGEELCSRFRAGSLSSVQVRAGPALPSSGLTWPPAERLQVTKL